MVSFKYVYGISNRILHILQLDEFIKKFNDMGPGSVGDDMNQGLELMDTFDSLFDTYDAQRLELGM